MGSVSVSALAQRQLIVTATDVPAGGSLQIIQGGVDYAGPNQPTAQTSVVSAYPDIGLTTGTVAFSVDTSTSSFVRSQVLDSTGAVVALSNPVWLLREIPANGIPAARAS